MQVLNLFYKVRGLMVLLNRINCCASRCKTNIAEHLDIFVIFQFLLFSMLFVALFIFFFLFLISPRYIRFKVLAVVNFTLLCKLYVRNI